jgi:rare lipoprotein A
MKASSFVAWRSAWRCGWLILLVLLLAACSSTPQRKRPHNYYDGAPPAPVDLSKIPEAIPKYEPLARYGNHSPYSVLGKNYSLLPSRVGYVERGIASWYGTKFHGRLTSNREPYDMYSFSAAHKTLPLPSYARVTNLENQKSIIVRINDRGPFVGDRIIDLSYVAALKLGFQEKGTAAVEVVTITPGEGAPTLPAPTAPAPTAPVAGASPIGKPEMKPLPTPTSAMPSSASPIASGLLLLQCGAFSDFANANALKLALLDAGFSDARVISGQDQLNRVVIGPLVDRASADALSQSIQASGFAAPKVLFQ